MQNLGIFPEAFDFSTVLNRYFLTCHIMNGETITPWELFLTVEKKKNNVPELIFKDGNLKCQVQRKGSNRDRQSIYFPESNLK